MYKNAYRNLFLMPPQIFGILAVSYTLEPFFTKVYMENMISAGEKVRACVSVKLVCLCVFVHFPSHSSFKNIA